MGVPQKRPTLSQDLGVGRWWASAVQEHMEARLMVCLQRARPLLEP